MTDQYNPKNPDAFKQVELPEPAPLPLNIEQVNENFSTLRNGSFQSKNFRHLRSGFKISEEGQIEAQGGIFGGTFILGGTLITVDDINDFQNAITAVSSLGGGTVSLVPDNYTVTGTVFTIPSNVTIEGNGAVIDFGGGAGQFLIQGSSAYSTGTLTATFGSANVVGVGTTWTAAMVGQSILIGDFWYTIATRTDNTHISLASTFLGTNLSGDTYIIATTADGVNIKNITLENSSTSVIKFRYVNGLTMDGDYLYNSTQGVDGSDSGGIFFLNSTVDTCTTGFVYNNVPFVTIDNAGILNGGGMQLTRVTNSTISTISIQGIVGVGVQFTNCSNISFENYAVIECTSHGLEFVSNNSDIDSLSGEVNTAGGDGIKLTATSDRITVVATSLLNNGGWGINIAAASCDNNQIIAPAFYNNTSGNINDLGTNTFISPQTISTLPDFTAAQDLAIGAAVGITNLLDNQLASALTTIKSGTHGITTPLISGQQWTAAPIGGDKYVYLQYTAAASDTLFAQVVSINRATQAATIGTVATVATAITPQVAGGAMKCAAICKLDTDKFVVFYLADASTTNIQYRVGTVSGTTITFGTAATFVTSASTAAAGGGNWAADYISTDKGVMAYWLATAANSRAVVFTCSGTVLTAGTQASMAAGVGNGNPTISGNFVKKIGTDKFAIVSCWGTGTTDIKTQVGTCTGTTTITFGSEVTINFAAATTRSNAVQIVSPATDVYVITSPSTTTAQLVTACTVSGTTVTAGAVLTLSASITASAAVGIYAQSASIIYIFYNGASNARASKVTLSGSTLTEVGTVFYDTNILTAALVVALDSGYFVVADNTGATNHTLFFQGMAYNFLGFVQSAYSQGQTISGSDVIISGVESNQSGLVAGAYYQVSNGALTVVDPAASATTPIAQSIVKAISPTQVIL